MVRDDAKQKMPEGTAWVDLGKFIVQSYHHHTFCLTLSVGRTLLGLYKIRLITVYKHLDGLPDISLSFINL